MMRLADRPAALFVLLALAGCGGGAEPPTGNVASPTPVPTVTSAAPPSVVTSSVPERLTVTTNEPFYSVAIDGDVLTLTGVDMPRRTLRVVDRKVTTDAREWNARDGRGTLGVRVVRAPCEDDMSGAPRDFTATLVMNGRTVRGCGYVGTPAPPPGETAATGPAIPARFVGWWNNDAAACARPAASIEGVRVTPRELWFHESVGVVKRVEPLAADRIRVIADYEGEGERWTATQTLRLDGNRLTIVTDGQPFTRIRCPK
ncbi:MAG: hypothetical protein PGN21_02605 [Sphingomonas paucimobilis]